MGLISRIAFTKGTIVIMIVTVFLLAVYNQINIRKLSKNANSRVTKVDSLASNKEVELVNEMGNLQRFMEKSWFAKQNGNIELTEFYIHELEETLELIEESNLIDDDIEISKLAKQIAIPSLKDLKKSINNSDTSVFNLKYANMVTSCNACHQMSGKKFIVIKIPSQNQYSNQEFKVK